MTVSKSKKFVISRLARVPAALALAFACVSQPVAAQTGRWDGLELAIEQRMQKFVDEYPTIGVDNINAWQSGYQELIASLTEILGGYGWGQLAEDFKNDEQAHHQLTELGDAMGMRGVDFIAWLEAMAAQEAGSGGDYRGTGIRQLTVKIADFCGNGNQCSVGQALDALNRAGASNPDSALGKAIERIQNDQQAELLNTLSGEAYASARSVLLANQRLRGAVQARMLGLDAQRLALGQPILLASNAPVAWQAAARQRLWADAWGYDGHTAADRNTARTDHSGLGLSLGGDAFVNDNLALGLMVGYEDGKVRSGGTRHSRVEVKSYSVGGYASVYLGGVDLRGGLLYSHLNLDSRRNLTALGLGHVKADYRGHKVQAFAEIAKPFSLNGTATLSPYANVTHTWLHTDRAQERGSEGALRIDAQNDRVLQTTLGVRGAIALPTTAPISLTANLGWQHAFGSNRAKASNTLTYNGASSRFEVEGVRQHRDRALVGVGVQAHLTPNATLSAGYDGQFGSKYRDHAGSVQFKLKF